MKPAIDEKLRLRQLGRKVKFAPKFLPPISEDGFGTRSIAMQLFRDTKQSLQINPGTVVVAIHGQLAQCIPHQVFGQDGLLTVRLVAGSGWLKIKTDGALF